MFIHKYTFMFNAMLLELGRFKARYALVRGYRAKRGAGGGFTPATIGGPCKRKMRLAALDMARSWLYLCKRKTRPRERENIMSWHFSNRFMQDFGNLPCSPEQAAASSGGISSDGEPSVPSSSTPTPAMFYWPGRTTDAFRPSRSGMTCEPLTDDRGEALLTLFLEASRVRTLAPPARAPASPESEADCGGKWHALSVRYDRATSSWKTHHCLWDEALPWSSVILPRWGMMRDGECWERTTSALRIIEPEYGWWPTPVKTDGFAVGWCQTSIERKEQGETRPSGARIGSGLKNFRKTSKYLSNGYPNPTLTEWLMGWPATWTDCAAPATDRFRQWCASHGSCFQQDQTVDTKQNTTP